MFKKEYLILLAVIIAACLYLYLKDRDQINYQLPEVTALEENQIAKIEISRPGEDPIRLEKADEKWRISPAGLPADEARVKEMLAALSGLTLTALVSESGDYERYDLSPERAIVVTARSQADGLLRRLTLGKRAASYHHTFVRLGEDPGVYHAGGSLHDTFDKDSDDLRDKTVLAFDPETVDHVAIAMAGETLELKKETPASLPPEAEGTAPAQTSQPSAVWTAVDGRPVDQTGIEGLLKTLANLKCGGYPAEGETADLKTPDYTVTLTGRESHTLSLFSRQAEDRSDYFGRSSQNASIFTLPAHQAEAVMKKPSELLSAAGKQS